MGFPALVSGLWSLVCPGLWGGTPFVEAGGSQPPCFCPQITAVCNFFTYIRYIQQGLVRQEGERPLVAGGAGPWEGVGVPAVVLGVDLGALWPRQRTEGRTLPASARSRCLLPTRNFSQAPGLEGTAPCYRPGIGSPPRWGGCPL